MPQVAEPVRPTKPSFDGKKYLEENLEKMIGTDLRVTQVATSFFRCNWYNRDQMAIVKSQFIGLEQSHEGPVIVTSERQ